MPARSVPLYNLGLELDGSRVAVSGEIYTAFDAYNYFYLCPDNAATDTYRACIDLVVPERLWASLPKKQGICVVITGKFNSFDRPDLIWVGNVYSDTGLIKVDHMARCIN